MVLEAVLVPVAHHFVATLKILLHCTAQQQAALTATGMLMFENKALELGQQPRPRHACSHASSTGQWLCPNSEAMLSSCAILT